MLQSATRISAALALLSLPLPLAGANAAAVQEEENPYTVFVHPNVLKTAQTVVIETDIRLGAQNAGQERRVKNEIERRLREWGRFEIVEDRELAELTITIVTTDQTRFFQGIYEPLTAYSSLHEILFVVAHNAGEYLVWADGTTDSFTGRQMAGYERQGWDNAGSRRIAARFVATFRERVETLE